MSSLGSSGTSSSDEDSSFLEGPSMGSSLSSALGAESVPMKASMPPGGTRHGQAPHSQRTGRLKRPHPPRHHAAPDTPPPCGGALQRAPGSGGECPLELYHSRGALHVSCHEPELVGTVRLRFAAAASVISSAMSTSAAERSWKGDRVKVRVDVKGRA